MVFQYTWTDLEFMMTRYRTVFFEPWVGKKYASTGLWSKKVLIVGESHYERFHSDKEDAVSGSIAPIQVLERSETQNCIMEVINGEGGATFWSSVRFRIGGREHEEDQASVFWNKVAFYNFVQTPVKAGPRASPTQKQFEDSSGAFLEVINDLNPERIITMGDRWLDYVPARNGKLSDVEYGNVKLPLEYYILENGEKAFVTHTSHPTSPWFARALTPVLSKFIVTDWD